MKPPGQTFWLFLILAALVYMPIFGQLNRQPIRVWDESRHAVNAIEMYDNGNYIVTHFKGKPDHRYTKPPLLVWCQVGLMKLIGINELAVRIPSAIAALLTIMLIFWFSVKQLSSPLYGFIASLILVTSNGYVAIHGTRTGDPDSLLTLFTTIGAIMLFLYMEKDKYKYLVMFFAAMVLAVLTKSVAGLMLAPGMLIYMAYRGKALSTLGQARSYMAFLIFLIPVASYYGLREYLDPGFLQLVWDTEVGGRYMNAIGGHKQEFAYYIKHMANERYAYWFVLIPVSLVIILNTKDARLKRLGTYSTILVVTYFLVISMAGTKLRWYDTPMYPLLALMLGIPIHNFLKMLLESEVGAKRKPLIKQAISSTFLIAVFGYPYHHIWQKAYKPSKQVQEWHTYSIANYLKRSAEGQYDVNNIHHVYDDYDAHIMFYHRVLRDQGNVIWVNELDRITTGDRVLIHQDDVLTEFQQKFVTTELSSYRHVKELKVTGKRPGS